MSKIAINNEIVLMRHAVRKSRVSLVRKLIKEVKLLRARKHGDKKIVEKCKRKAERLAAEIETVKKIKDDEISKFGIKLTRSLPEILNDPTSEANTRVMARLASHKFLSERIRQFKEKFPAFEEHLGPGRKKLSKLQRKANREAINRIKAGVETGKENGDKNEASNNGVGLASNHEDGEKEQEDEISDEDEDVAADDRIRESADEEKSNNESTDNESLEPDQEPGSILRIKNRKSSGKRKTDDDPRSEESDLSETEAESQKLKKSKILVDDSIKPRKSGLIPPNLEPKTSITATENPVDSKKSKITPKTSVKPKKSIKSIQNVEKPKKSIPIKVISEEASVKRFTDLMEDKESLEIVKPTTNPTNARKDVKVEKQIDSFFMTANGESEYMSVVVPKSKLCEEEEQDDRFAPNHAAKRQKNFHEKNNKFFSKIDQRSNHDYSNKFASNTNQRGQNHFSNPKNHSDKYPRHRNDFVANSRNSKPEFTKNNDVKDEELHPSWQARKKQQEILKQGFQGKKIVFDD